MDLPILSCKVTYLEIHGPSNINDIDMPEYSFVLWNDPDLDLYIDLYREIGRDYIWNYRPGQSREEIREVIQSDQTRIYLLYKNNTPIGMAECDLDDKNGIEIVHFGLIPDFINKGIGKVFLQKVLYTLSQEEPARIHLSTCELDHPKAIEFYQNAGFDIYKTKRAEFKDYRYSDFYDLSDAPGIPHPD